MLLKTAWISAESPFHSVSSSFARTSSLRWAPESSAVLSCNNPQWNGSSDDVGGWVDVLIAPAAVDDAATVWGEPDSGGITITLLVVVDIVVVLFRGFLVRVAFVVNVEVGMVVPIKVAVVVLAAAAAASDAVESSTIDGTSGACSSPDALVMHRPHMYGQSS